MKSKNMRHQHGSALKQIIVRDLKTDMWTVPERETALVMCVMHQLLEYDNAEFEFFVR